MVCEGKIRRQGLYAEADINSIVAAQLQHYQVQQRVQQHPGNSCAGRDAAQISEGDHMVLKARQSQCDRDGMKAAVNQLPWYAYNEGQGAEGAQSFCEGQRSDQKFELEKQDGEDPKNQDHGNKIEARYKDNTRPRTFDSLEHKFHRDILLLPKEQHDKEDAEIAWHSEVNFQAALASESLLNEEAVMAAAASEAVALARAGVVAAREVARMVQTDYDQPVIRSHKAVDSFLVKEILRTEMELSSTNGHTGDDLLEEIEFYSIKSDKAELDDGKYAKCIAVKSARQSERRARRVRAATKASTILSTAQKPVTSPKKKRSKGSLSGTNPLGSLWKMTGRRLLTAKQEIEFSKGIQDLLNLEAIQTELAEYNGGQPTFSQWAAAAGIDENTLRKRIDHGIYCKNRMVTSNVRLVISIAREFEGSGMELYDLIQEGMQGLIRGAEKFDASKGFRFSTYSHWWIKQAMRKSASEQSHIFRLPAHMVDASYRVKECTKRFRRQLKRRPTNEEIALETGMPVKRVEAAVNLPKYTISLDSKVGCTDMTYQEITPDPSAETAEVILNRWLMKKEVNKALDSLTAREKQVVRLRFGLDDGRIKTLQEIGNLMGVSRERIRQIESGAFRKLRNKKRVDALKHYLDPVDNW